ncbi:MAG: polynucleotide adenylyltransferase PcnB [Desulfovibrionales bacterium]
MIIRSRSEHTVSRKNIDADALKVLYRLSRHGHTAHLVGGGVRDLLLGRTPKDYDIGTSAKPNQIKKLFRNAMLIGKRFRLAHIRFGPNIIETSTFRRMPEINADPSDPDADLFCKRDNTFGSPEEDALRRDFTINGLFYDIKTFSVIDHVGGLEDLEKRLVRCIGDPAIRFREDPVRMLRAVRFASRLGFAIEQETYRAILEHHEEIRKAPAQRVIEEVLRLFSYGSGEPAFRLLRETGLLQDLFPEIDRWLDMAGESETGLFWKMLEALDRLEGVGDAPPPALALAVLFHAPLQDLVRSAKEQDPKTPFASLVNRMLRPVALRMQIPKRIFFRMLMLYFHQARFDPESKRRFSKAKFVRQETFAEALWLYAVRVGAGQGDESSLAKWQEEFEQVRGETGQDSGSGRAPRKGKGTSPRSRARKKSGGHKKSLDFIFLPNPSREPESFEAGEQNTSGNPGKKRKRRPRKRKNPESGNPNDG